MPKSPAGCSRCCKPPTEWRKPHIRPQRTKPTASPSHPHTSFRMPAPSTGFNLTSHPAPSVATLEFRLCRGSHFGQPSPERVPELHGNGAHLFGFTAALHRGPALTAERTARPESKDGKELQDGSAEVRGCSETPQPHIFPPTPPPPPALSHGHAGRDATLQLSALCASSVHRQ